jgi:hypothetical protein
MSCCGKSRSQPFVAAGPAAQPQAIAVRQQKPAVRSTVAVPAGLAPGTTFQYIGKTRLTVIGPVSRRRYDFDRGGVRLSVDPRDASSLATVPTLKRV